MEFKVVQGDITEQEADAIVEETSGNSNLISKALSESVEEELQENADSDQGPILGEPVETSAPGLNADYVIHIQTVGYQMHPNRTAHSTQNVLLKADELGCGSVVLPIIYSTYSDVDPCAHMMFNEILDYEPENLTDVRVIVRDCDTSRTDNCYQTVQRIAEEARETEAE